MSWMKSMISGACVCSALALSACSAGAPDKAWAEIHDFDGKRAGSAIIDKTDAGLDVNLRVKGLPSGEYGFRFHSYGECDLPDFINAGAPLLGEADTEEGAYDGTFAVRDGENAELDVTLSGVTLAAGDRSLFHAGGTSIVIHTVPSGPGEYSRRVACGVVVPYGAADVVTDSLPEGSEKSAVTPRELGPGGTTYRKSEGDTPKP